MTKRFKLIKVVMVFTVISMLLIGCNASEMKVFNALIKQNNMTSYESDTSIKVNVNVTGLSEEKQMEIQELLYMINNSDITLHQQMESNEEQTKVKSQTNIGMNFAGIVMDMNLWVDSDLSGDELSMKEIFQLPPLMMMSMPESYRNKEYMVLDLSDIYQNMGQEEVAINSEILKETTELSKEFQLIAEAFFKEYAKDFNFKKNIISYKGKETIDGKTAMVYQLKLDDETFKEFLRYATHRLIESDSTEDLVREYFSIITKFTEDMNTENEVEKEEMTQSLNEMLEVFSEDSREEVLNDIDTFFDTIDNFNILGEEGLLIDFKLDKKGNILNTNGKIHFSINQNDFNNINIQQYNTKREPGFTQDTPQTKDTPSSVENMIIDIKLEFNQDIYNINEEINIEIPELTEENSVNYMDMFKIEQEMMNTQEEVYNTDSNFDF
ncbi:MAG: hypothetical protein FH761_02805 [Firmicutes bacterium]|nr:hypothetical protein [Bacillota bacterium]